MNKNNITPRDIVRHMTFEHLIKLISLPSNYMLVFPNNKIGAIHEYHCNINSIFVLMYDSDIDSFGGKYSRYEVVEVDHFERIVWVEKVI